MDYLHAKVEIVKAVIENVSGKSNKEIIELLNMLFDAISKD